MAWKVNIDGKSIMLDDLSADDFVKACKDYPDVNWLRLYTSPASNPGALYELLCLCAAKLEKPSPDRPQNVRDSVSLLSYIEQCDDDLPTAFDEGGVPLEDTDAPETTTSSTSTGPEDGPLSEPEPQA